MKTCLVADDSQIIRRVARKILEEAGLQVLEAENGEEALTVIKATKPHVVLIDWYMPQSTGMDLMEKLAELPKSERPVMIFCTTETHIANIEKALAAGADEYILKPFDRDILLTKLRQTGIIDEIPA